MPTPSRAHFASDSVRASSKVSLPSEMGDASSENTNLTRLGVRRLYYRREAQMQCLLEGDILGTKLFIWRASVTCVSQ